VSQFIEILKRSCYNLFDLGYIKTSVYEIIGTKSMKFHGMLLDFQ